MWPHTDGSMSLTLGAIPVRMQKIVVYGFVVLSLANPVSGFPQTRTTISSPPQAAAAMRHEQTLNLKRRIAVGEQPYGLAFDGQNIWAANHTGSSVTKVRVSDGAILGTFAVGRGPYGVAFDGTNIWATSNVENTVTKLRASDGKNLGTFGVGKGPWWLCSDGSNIWVANGDGSVTKLRADDGQQLGTYRVGKGAIAVAFDGNYAALN